MKSGINLVALATELQRREEAKQDFVAPASCLEFGFKKDLKNGLPVKSSAGFLHVKGQENPFHLQENAFNQITTYLGMPSKWANILRNKHPELLENDINTIFGKTDSKRMVRTLDGSARAFLSDRYNRIDNWDLTNQILPIFGEMGDAVSVRSCNVTDRNLYIKVAFPRVQREVQKGDVVQSGFILQNSEIGLGSTSVYPFIERLVCTNGMVVKDGGMRKAHLGKSLGNADTFEIFTDETRKKSDEAFLLQVRDSVIALTKEEHFERIVDRMREKSERQIKGSVAKVVEVLGKEAQLNQGEQESVLEHLIKGGDLSQWGLINAVTRTAEDSESYDRATELEALGGDLLAKDAVFEVIEKAVA